MKEEKLYKKDTADFFDKIKDLCEIPVEIILGTADVVGLYPSIPHTEGLEVLQKCMTIFCIRRYPQKILYYGRLCIKKPFQSFPKSIWNCYWD